MLYLIIRVILSLICKDIFSTKDFFMNILQLVLTCLSVVFGLLYAYQVLFMIIGIFSKKKKFPEAKEQHTFAFLIAARNESKVIGNLINSIRNNDYPQDKIKIFIVADNCEDNTAELCRNLGCTVYERFNKEQVERICTKLPI